ncbi:MAG: polysaccharide biosynthesis tyrosine autokinase, partial [Bacteroidaceae bacterium]|nr:polysaccharide biosynthesis tyrosine autokinase [Bacteroidaceae bacterium]
MAEVSENKNYAQEEERSNNMLNIALFCLTVLRKNWRWFLLSIIVCLGLAYLYAKRQPRIFRQSATILISEGEPKTNKSRAFNSIQDLSGISGNDNLKDEMFVLTSRRLIGRVVDKLKLDVSYNTTMRLTPVSLFEDTPVLAEFLEPFKGYVMFEAEINGNSVKVDKLRFDGEKTGFQKTVTFGEPFKTPAGIVVLKKTKNTRKYNNKTIRISRSSREDAITSYRSRIGASENDKDANLITISCLDANRGRANKILNTLLDVYKADIVDVKNTSGKKTAEFIDERIALIGSQLSDVERDLVNFKQESNLLDFNLNVTNYLQESTASHQTLLDLETRLAVVSSLRDFIVNSANNEKLIPVLGALGNASMESQINQYNQLMIERNNLLANSSITAPTIVQRDQVLKDMRHTICAGIDSYVNSIRIQLAKARGSDDRLRSQMTSTPQAEIKTLDITRQQKVKEALYTYLLNKREENALQLAINDANVRIVEYPYGVKSPVSPHTGRILLVAFILGLGIPAAIFWFLITMDKTVRGRKDIEDSLSAPILGDIPRWDDERNEKKFLTKEDNGKTISEAFRVLRYNLNMISQDGVIAITSSTPSQGKSFISRNLAAILAIGGAKTMLIDADIRKNSVSEVLGLKRTSYGLTSYLAKQCEVDDIIVKGVSENLDMIPAGVRPPNPAELLMSSRLDTLIKTLREDHGYKYVIVDCTPTINVADAGIVNRVAD